jgi:glutathione S-transferase
MRLITIAISHFCEKARWALDLARVAYVEEAHPPLVHLVAIKRAGATGDTVPVLVTPEGTLSDSTDILRWADARAGLGLYAHDEAAPLEDGFDESLGPHVRRWAYSFVLRDGAVTRALLTTGASRRASLAYRVAQPAITSLMWRGLNITDESVERSRRKVEEAFDEVEARLKDGRPYLCGDRFTAADLTFAALAAPVVGVEGYGPPGVKRPDAPPVLEAAFAPLRARPAAEHVRRLYREQRRLVATGGRI